MKRRKVIQMKGNAKKSRYRENNMKRGGERETKRRTEGLKCECRKKGQEHFEDQTGKEEKKRK